MPTRSFSWSAFSLLFFSTSACAMSHTIEPVDAAVADASADARVDAGLVPTDAAAPVYTTACTQLTRVSTAADGTQGNGHSREAHLSPNGTEIVFTSRATNLVAADNNAAEDVFVKDLRDGAVSRISTSGNGAFANGDSGNPSFSPDGERVAFESDATNLVANDTNAVRDIFVSTLATGGVERYSVGPSGAEADAASMSATFHPHPDGSQVLFATSARVLLGVGDGAQGLVMRDPALGSLVAWVGGFGLGRAQLLNGPVQFSPDGQRLLFATVVHPVPLNDDLHHIREIFVLDYANERMLPIAPYNIVGGLNAACGEPAPRFSPDGTKVLFHSNVSDLVPNDTNGRCDLFLASLTSAPGIIIERVSVAENGDESDGHSVRGDFSPDGTRVVFESDATTLAPGVPLTPFSSDLFIKDLATGEVSRVFADRSLGLGREPPRSTFPAGRTFTSVQFSPDGRSIAFVSPADNLVASDTNNADDVFICGL